MQAAKPLINFELDGTPDRLRTNVPEPGSYNGRNYIDLGLPLASFIPKKGPSYKIPPEVMDPAKQSQVLREIAVAMKNGFDSQIQNVDPTMDKYFPDFPTELRGRLKFAGPIPGDPKSDPFANPDNPANYILLTDTTSLEQAALAVIDAAAPQPRRYTGVYLLEHGQNSIDTIAPDLQTLTPAEVLASLQRGLRLKVAQELNGQYSYTYLPVYDPPRPILALVEYYRLTTFLGSYGASRTIKTLSLLPGEKAKLTMSSYTRKAETLKQASSILDSLTQESADDFQKTVESEVTDKNTAARSDEWQVEAKVQGRWGTGSASISGGAAGSTNSAREQIAKNVTNAVQKHAAKASSKRTVNIDQTAEDKTESGEETGVVRDVQNINVGRTLNFVFRQMSQEYISLLHMVDVGIAFSDGTPGSERIVPLWKIDSLLAEVIIDPPPANSSTPGAPLLSRTQIKNWILRELRYIRDYQDKPQQFYELFTPTKVENGAPVIIDSYLRPRRDLSYSYTFRGTTVTVPGVLLAATTNVMYTDGVLVDTILGQSEALDDYSKSLRDAAGQAETASNDLLAADLAIEQLRQQIVSGKQADKATTFAAMFPQPTP